MSPKLFKKLSVAELLAQSLEGQIREERWRGLIPSGRALAFSHQVSLPNVQKALSLLVERKVLLYRGDRRRLEVAVEVTAEARPSMRREVLVLSTKPLVSYDAALVLALYQLQVNLQRDGHGFRLIDLSHLEGDLRYKAVREQMKRFRPSHCIMLAPDVSVYSGVSEFSAKLASIYGDLRTTKVMRLGLSFAPLVKVCVRELAKLGHRHFFMPFLGRDEKFASSLSAIVDEAKQQEVKIAVKSTPLAVTHDRMEKALRKGLDDGATAILFPEWQDFLSAIPFFVRNELEFPRDLSVVVMQSKEESATYYPPLAGCLSRDESLLHQVEYWIQSGQSKMDAYEAIFENKWNPRASVGPVRPPVRT